MLLLLLLLLLLACHHHYSCPGAGGVIPGGATLRFDVEVVDFGTEAPQGAGRGQAPPTNLFKTLDVTPEDGQLSKDEVMAFFKSQGKDELPPGMWESEDKDGNGFISWEEFSGPKGQNEEL